MKSMKLICLSQILTATLALPQLQPQSQSQSQFDSPLQTTLQPQQAQNAGSLNAVGFADSNRAGFNPFEVKKGPLMTGAEAAQDVLIVASVIAAFVIPEPFGVAIGVLLQGIAMLFAPKPPSPDQIYQEIYGRIQNQINTVLNNQGVSVLVNNLQTLSQNLNDQTVAYLAQMGITGNTKNVLHDMTTGRAQIPFITSIQVDQQMKIMDAMLGASGNWFTSIPHPISVRSAFILANVPGLGADRCLHTKNFNLADGTDLIVDSQCNMNSVDDKMFGIGPDSRLIFRSNAGDKCVTFNNDDGNNESAHLAIFDVNSTQCKSDHVMKLFQTKRGNWAIYDGERMMCVGDGTGDDNANVIVSYRNNGCLNNDNLEFQMMIPVLINPTGLGGSSGNSVTPPNTYDEIGVQLFYFTRFAGIHLAALKEMYLHGSSVQYAKQQFGQKVKEYTQWLSAAIPTFEGYATFKDMNATSQIIESKNFLSSLHKATLNYDKPIQIRI